MPDWSYQTLFRPALFRMPARLARDATLRAIGTLSRIPGGSLVIRTLGHMESYPILASTVRNVALPYPVGLSGELDVRGTAHQALAQFGFGFIEIGPITLRERSSPRPVHRNIPQESIRYPIEDENEGLDAAIRRLGRDPGHRLPLLVRTRNDRGNGADEAVAEHLQLMANLRPYASGFIIDLLDRGMPPEEAFLLLEEIARSSALAEDFPLFLHVPLDYPLESLQTLLDKLDSARWDGFAIGDTIHTLDGAYEVGKAGLAPCLDKVKAIRERIGEGRTIIAGAGVHQPQDALDLMKAGADFIQLHSGLVYAGPGLPKRINEAIVHQRIRHAPPPPEPSFWSGWGWTYLMGLGMIIGGVLAWLIAMTGVVLSYDIDFLNISKEKLEEINERLLPFMSHDRISLAGTMISIGILYAQLARHGLRRKLHWARTALFASGTVGFCSFLLYLGYGYFDPLHAVAAAILLPMFLLGMRDRTDRPSRTAPNLRNNRTWKQAQWGQLLMVTLGLALAVGGLTISFVGITAIFVPTDLAYLHATHGELAKANPHLLPLIAHDRAGFGGALLSDAIAILAIALWGVQQGESWLWRTLLLGGIPGFFAVFFVHARIGYVDFGHLLPAYFAALLFILGLILLYPYLMKERD